MNMKILSIVLGLLIFGMGVMVSEAQITKSVDAVLRELWEKAGNAIFPANLGWNVGIGTSTPQERLTVSSGSIALEMAIPLNVTAVPAPGGFLSSGTYYFIIAASNGMGMTKGSAEVSCTVNGISTNRCALSWGSVPGASLYKIYKGSSSGGQDRYQVSATNSYNYDTDAGSAFGTVPIVTDAYLHKIEDAGGFWTLGRAGIGTHSPTQQLEVAGGIRLNSSSSKPACTQEIFGTLWFDKSDPDGILELCKFGRAETPVNLKGASLPTPRKGAACAEDSSTNKIYCFGGENGPTTYNTITEYNPATDTLSTKSATLPTPLSFMACAEDSSTHKIYCFGGQPGYVGTVLEYNPASDTLISKGSLIGPRAHLSCAEDSATHTIYCFGGIANPYPTYLTEIFSYTPSTNTVSTLASLPSQKMDLSCAENSQTNRIYCFGGGAPSSSYDIVEYIPFPNKVSLKDESLPLALLYHSCAEDSDSHKIYCLGGPGPLNDDIIEYDPVADKAALMLQSLPSARRFLSCAENSASHLIYCFGGEEDGSNMILDDILEYGVFPALQWIPIA